VERVPLTVAVIVEVTSSQGSSVMVGFTVVVIVEGVPLMVAVTVIGTASSQGSSVLVAATVVM
jgi:hypothetical protein